MDYRQYALLSEPIVIMTIDGYIQYVNAAALSWMSMSESNEMVGKVFDEFVVFQDAGLLATLPQLQPWQFTQYAQTVFKLPVHGFSGVAKISVQCVPVQEDLSLYVVSVLDKTLIETFWEKEVLDFNNAETFSAPEPATEPEAPAAPAFVLQTDHLMKAMPTEPVAQLTSRALLTIPMLRLSLKVQAVLISENWIDFHVKSPQIKPGLRATIEMLASSEIQPFTCAAFVETYRLEQAETYLGRFKFDNISASAKKVITTYIEKNGIRIA